MKREGPKKVYSKAIEDNLPIDPITKKAIQNFVDGFIPESKIVDEVVKDLARPSNILSRYPRTEGFGNSLSNEISKLGRFFNEVIDLFRKQIDELVGIENKNKIKNGIDLEMKSIKPNLVFKIFQSETEKDKLNIFKKNRISLKDCYALSEIKSFEYMPSIQAYYLFISNYFRGHALTARKVKISDSGDAYHCLYAPYTDIFRADKYTSELIKEFETTFNIVIVNKLENLQEKIKDLLKTRKNSF